MVWLNSLLQVSEFQLAEKNENKADNGGYE